MTGRLYQLVGVINFGEVIFKVNTAAVNCVQVYHGKVQLIGINCVQLKIFNLSVQYNSDNTSTYETSSDKRAVRPSTAA